MQLSTSCIVHSHPEKTLTSKHLRAAGLRAGGLHSAEGSCSLPVPWASKTPRLPPARWVGMGQGDPRCWAAERGTGCWHPTPPATRPSCWGGVGNSTVQTARREQGRIGAGTAASQQGTAASQQGMATQGWEVSEKPEGVGHGMRCSLGTQLPDLPVNTSNPLSSDHVLAGKAVTQTDAGTGGWVLYSLSSSSTCE